MVEEDIVTDMCKESASHVDWLKMCIRDRPYGNGEIAEMLGVSRNSVTASVSRLQSQGVVEKRRNSMRVVDLDKLREIAYLKRE